MEAILLSLLDQGAAHANFLLTIVLTGIAGGLISGLLGVGGGIIIVPVLFNLLSEHVPDPSLRMKMAVATSLCTVVFTSFISLNSHKRRDSIDYCLFRVWILPLTVGVIAGSVFGGSVDGRVLSGVFSIVGLFVALQMVLNVRKENSNGEIPTLRLKAIYGFLIGFFSALMGIGGGTLTVPLLTAFGYDIRRAVGTASAIGIVIAVPGTIGYIATGINAEDLPPFSLGYMNWAAALALVPITMVIAPIGAWIAHTISRSDLPPLKWSSLKYDFGSGGTGNGEEKAYGRRDRREAAAGRCANGTGATGRGGGAIDRRDGSYVLSMAK